MAEKNVGAYLFLGMLRWNWKNKDNEPVLQQIVGFQEPKIHTPGMQKMPLWLDVPQIEETGDEVKNTTAVLMDLHKQTLDKG